MSELPEQGGYEDRPPPAPRWVKVSAVAALLLLITVVIIHLSGGGFGNHMRH